MKRRNVEGDHPFAKFVAAQCNIYELGGLLVDKNWNFTAAVEAFEVDLEESKNRLSDLINSNSYAKVLYIDGIFAQKLGIPFYIIVHVKTRKSVYLYEVCSDYNTNKLICVKTISLSEDEFIQWWQQMKGTVQTKIYRRDFKDRAKNSYFDNLLESHRLKWGGNIDGYLIADNDHTYEITAIIENRFTNKTPLSEYDPNFFYSDYNGGDYHTWLPLIKLKDQLKVPLFLMTYSNRNGEQNQVGMTRILGQSKDSGLIYMQDQHGHTIRPCDNLFHDLSDIKEWVIQNMGESKIHER